MFPELTGTHISPYTAARHSPIPRVHKVFEPTTEFVTQDDYSDFIRMKQSPTPRAVADKLRAAREICESYTGVYFGGHMLDIYYDFVGPYFSGWTILRIAEYYSVISIPRIPATCIVGMWLRSADGVETQLDPSMYTVSRTHEPCRISINTWPFTEVLNFPYVEQFRIRVVAGYHTPVSINTATDLLSTEIPHGYVVGDSVRFRACKTIPAGLVENTDYYVRTAPSATTFNLNDSAGNPVDVTDTGDGATFVSLYQGGLPIRAYRAILSVASHDRFASDPRSLRKIDAQADLPKAAINELKHMRRFRLY